MLALRSMVKNVFPRNSLRLLRDPNQELTLTCQNDTMMTDAFQSLAPYRYIVIGLSANGNVQNTTGKALSDEPTLSTFCLDEDEWYGALQLPSCRPSAPHRKFFRVVRSEANHTGSHLFVNEAGAKIISSAFKATNDLRRPFHTYMVTLQLPHSLVAEDMRACVEPFFSSGLSNPFYNTRHKSVGLICRPEKTLMVRIEPSSTGSIKLRPPFINTHWLENLNLMNYQTDMSDYASEEPAIQREYQQELEELYRQPYWKPQIPFENLLTSAGEENEETMQGDPSRSRNRSRSRSRRRSSPSAAVDLDAS